MYRDFFSGLFAYLDAEKRERIRQEWGITNENGCDGVSKVDIPHEYTRITIKNDNFYCEHEGLLTVYNYGGRKLFTSRDIINCGDGIYLVEIIDEEIVKEDWGYALYSDGEKLTDDIFKPEGWNREFNKNGFLVVGLVDEKKVLVVIDKKGEIIFRYEGERYSLDIFLYGVIAKTEEGYLNLLTNSYICKKAHYSSDTMDNGECLFIKTEETCVYQINMKNGEFVLHGKEKEEEKPFTEEEQKEHEANLLASKKLLAERKIETKEWENIGRNDSCKCGSGKKFKKCCRLNWKEDLIAKFQEK